MKNHTLLAQDEDNQTRVYSCRSGHVHVIYRRTNIAVSQREFGELFNCVMETSGYLQKQDPSKMESKHIDVTFDETVVKMPLTSFRIFVRVLERAMISFKMLTGHCNESTEVHPEVNAKLIPFSPCRYSHLN